jgi:hypothetical protein
LYVVTDFTESVAMNEEFRAAVKIGRKSVIFKPSPAQGDVAQGQI